MFVLFMAPPLTLQSGQGKLMPAGPKAKQTSQTQLSAGTLAKPTQRWCKLMLHMLQKTIRLSSV